MLSFFIIIFMLLLMYMMIQYNHTTTKEPILQVLQLVFEIPNQIQDHRIVINRQIELLYLHDL